MYQRVAKRDRKLRGAKTYRKTPPKNVFGPPPTYAMFPPLCGDSLSFLLNRRKPNGDGGKGTGKEKRHGNLPNAVTF